MAAPVIAAGGVCTGVRVVEFVAGIHIVLPVSADPCLSMEVEGGGRETECVRMPPLLRRRLPPVGNAFSPPAIIRSSPGNGWWESGAVAEGGARPDRITVAMQDRIVSYLSPHKHNRNE